MTVHHFPNRMTLIHRRNESNSIAAVTCLARPGALADPPEKAGRMHLMMRLLSKGTASRSADQIAEAFEGMGARFGASENYDYVGVSLQCVRDDLGRAMNVYADILRNPSFPLDEIQTERNRVLGEIRAREDRPPSAAMRRFRQQLFSPGPYGVPLEGFPETVAQVTQIDLVEAHRTVFQPENMVFAIVGDISFEEARKLVESSFGDLPALGTPLSEASRRHSPRSRHERLERATEQGFVTMGTVTMPMDHDDSPAMDLAAAVLGQGMSARLFRELRDRRGLAYMVGAFNRQYRHAGMFGVYIGTSPETVATSVREHGDPEGFFTSGGIDAMEWASRALWAEVEQLKLEPVPQAELERARSYLIGGYLRGHEANSQQAHYLAFWHTMGLGVDYDERYPELLREVTSRDVMRVANKYFLDPTTVILAPDSAAARPGER